MSATTATVQLAAGAAAVFVVAFLLYLPALDFEFVWDDRTILLAHEGLDDWSRAIANLTGNFFAETGLEGSFDYWRPMVVLSHMIEMTLFGPHPRGFHLTNVLLHAVASVLVLLLARQWFDPPHHTSLVAGLLFAVHPVHVEVVAWVSGRSDLLFGFFLLLALIADRRWSVTGTRRWQAVSLTSFACALLSKEAAAVFPLLVAARALLELPRDVPLQGRVRRAMGAAVPPLITLGIYLWLRFAIVGVSPVAADLSSGGRLADFWAWWSAFWQYTQLLVWPSTLNILHQVEASSTPLAPGVVAGLTVFLCLAWFGWWQRRRNPGNTYGIWIWLACLLPATHFLVPLSSQAQSGFPFAERFLYAPSIGSCLAAGWLLARGLPRLLRRWLSSRSAASATENLEAVLALMLPLLMILGPGARTWIRSQEWRSELTLFAATVAQVPENGTAQLNYAAALGDRAEREIDPSARQEWMKKARLHFGQALDLAPENYRVHFGLGNLHRLEGRAALAEASYRESLRLYPNLYPARLNLGALLAEQGDLLGAKEMFESALRL